jgi:hypothetical protein
MTNNTTRVSFIRRDGILKKERKRDRNGKRRIITRNANRR